MTIGTAILPYQDISQSYNLFRTHCR